MFCEHSVYTGSYLRYNDICHGFCHCVKILGFVKPQNFHVVLQVVLNTVVDVGNLADVIDVAVRPEVFDKFAPATLHQLPRLTMIQCYLCHVQHTRHKLTTLSLTASQYNWVWECLSCPATTPTTSSPSFGDRDCTAQYNCRLPVATDCQCFGLFSLILYGAPAMSLRW